MEIMDLPLEGLKLIKPKIFKDERGFFLEQYRRCIFREGGINCDFVQDNHSFSAKNTLRGMHFQTSPGQAKLISVVNGKILDVVVDIRPSSKTYKKWYSITIDDINYCQLFVPVGFAHGYCILSENKT